MTNPYITDPAHDLQAIDRAYRFGQTRDVFVYRLLGADGNKIVTYKNEKTTIYELLKRKINIIHLTERLVKQYAETTGHQIAPGRMDLLDLVNKYPVKSPAHPQIPAAGY